jgi:hypothetical protein
MTCRAPLQPNDVAAVRRLTSADTCAWLLPRVDCIGYRRSTPSLLRLYVFHILLASTRLSLLRPLTHAM